MQRFVAVNEGMNVTYAAVVAKISLARRRQLSVFRSKIVANNQMIAMEKSSDLNAAGVGRGAQFLNTKKRATSQRDCCSVDSVLIFEGRFQKTEQMSKSKLAAAGSHKKIPLPI
jgi:hypothetical protein